MLVSAIIPVYNRPRLVARAVRSVLEQEGPGLECIVVDDGSTDGTGGVLRDLEREARGRMRVLTRDNRGVASARNAGIRAAQGELLALLDSDDQWLPGKVAKQAAFLKDQGLEICQTQEIWMRGGRRVNPGARYEKPSGRFLERALEACVVSPSCVMFTQRFVREVGLFDETLPACEDYDLWLRTLPRFPIGLLDEPLTVRHGGRGDQLSTMFTGMDLFRVRALAKLAGSGLVQGRERRMVLGALEAKARVYAAGCLKRGRMFEAERVAGMVARTRAACAGAD